MPSRRAGRRCLNQAARIEPAPAHGQIGLRDGWILTGSVVVPQSVGSVEISVFIDKRLAGHAVANMPLGGSVDAGWQRLGFEYVPRFVRDPGDVHLVEFFDPSGALIGRLSTTLLPDEPCGDPSSFLDWLSYHRLVRAPFNADVQACLSYFDWYASRCAAEAATRPAPPVTVVMPCYNSADTLPRAIESVVAQSHAAWQLIVVDDGSDEPLDEVQARYPDPRITFVRLPSNQGSAGARNAAVPLVQGALVAFLDADNYWDHRFLAVMASALEASPDRDMAYCGQYLREDPAGTAIAVRMGGFNPSLLENENYIDMNCVIIRRQALDRLDWFDPSLVALQDWDLFLRLTDEKAPLFVPVTLSHYISRPPTALRASRVSSCWSRLVEKRRARDGVQTFTAEIDGGIKTFWSRPSAATAPRRQSKVSIVIPSDNVAPVLSLCVERVYATVDVDRTEVIICDNGSDAQTLAATDRLQRAYPTLKVDHARCDDKVHARRQSRVVAERPRQRCRHPQQRCDRHGRVARCPARRPVEKP